jgi:methionine-rich copper-binding protein CopC
MKYLASFTSVTLLAVVLMICRPAPVSAHSEYDHSNPTAGSTVAAVPTTIKVWFTETVQLAGSSLKVTNAAGQQVDSKDVTLDPSDSDHKILVVSLPSGLPAGTYTVDWKTVSADDGDEDEGQFDFTVRTAAVTSPAPAGGPVAKPAAPAQAPSALPRTGEAEPHSPVSFLVVSGLLLVVGAASLRRTRAA